MRCQTPGKETLATSGLHCPTAAASAPVSLVAVASAIFHDTAHLQNLSGHDVRRTLMLSLENTPIYTAVYNYLNPNTA